MKSNQAILILAHYNFDQIEKLIDTVNSKFNVYIHIDKKSKIDQDTINRLKTKQNTKIIRTYAVHWGAYSIVAATIELIKLAKLDNNQYYHLISGDSWPAKNINEIYEFYNKSQDIFMEIKPLGGIYKTGESILCWQKFYYPYDLINRKTLFGKIFHRIIYIIQLILRVDKRKRYSFNRTLYTGSAWFSLPIDVVDYFLATIDNEKNILEFFRTSFCSDEFIFQTVIGNSQFRTRIVNSNCMFIKWKRAHGAYPGIIDESDIKDIEKIKPNFMRKVDLKISQGLLKRLLK